MYVFNAWIRMFAGVYPSRCVHFRESSELIKQSPAFADASFDTLQNFF